MVAIYFFLDPLDKILSEGQKRCAEVRRVEDAEVRRGGRATVRAGGFGRKVPAYVVGGTLRDSSTSLRMTA